MRKTALLILSAVLLLTGLSLPGSATSTPRKKDVEILNVSYDPTRELYAEYNKAFAKHWLKRKNQKVTIKQSHGGSGKQARSVIEGLRADVVTLALAQDITEIEKRGLIRKGWEKTLPRNSSPYTSTIVFVVRKGNPKKIKDWNDLVRPGVQVITPNPKTSGGARWNYLAAWAYALRQNKNNEARAQDFVRRLYKNVKVLDSGARGSTNTFVQNGIGDVFISWENEAFLIKKEEGDKYEIVNPSLSILAEPPVAVVTRNVERKKTREVATAYLNYLYSKEGQRIIARNFYRPSDPQVAKEFANKFRKINMVTIRDFGGWAKAQKKHFADDGTFDKIYR